MERKSRSRSRSVTVRRSRARSRKRSKSVGPARGMSHASTQTAISMIRIPNVTGIADVTRVKLRYSSVLSLASGGSNFLTKNTYRGNGPYDPDQTGSGVQPLGYDQWSAFYNKQRTRGSKISVTMSNTNTTYPCIVVVYPSLVSTALTTQQEVLSQPYAIKSLMSVATGTSRSHTLSRYMSTKKIFGLKSIDDEDNFASDITTTPADQWYWHVYIMSPDSSFNASAMGTVSITYYIEYFTRVQLTSS